jgi:hypothetical protein
MMVVYEFLFGPSPTEFQIAGIQLMFWFFVTLVLVTVLAGYTTESYEKQKRLHKPDPTASPE